MAATDYFLILLAPSFLLILSLLFLRNKIQSTNTTNSFKETSPCHLQALCTILTPTNSAWPTQYASLLTCKIRRNPDVIEIQLLKLINNIRLGAVELRDPRVLGDILRGQLYVYGWKVSIGLDLPRQPCGFLYFRRLYSLCVGQERKLGSMQFPSMSEAKSPVLLPLYCTASAHDLDMVPSSRLAPTIRAIQSSIREAETAAVEFTSLAPHVTVTSRHFVLCSLLSLFKYPRSQSALAQLSFPSTPMHHFVQLLSTGPSSNVKITSMTDISENSAERLLKKERELATDDLVRKVYVEKWGHEAWREKRFLLSWESGLLASGCLMRWRVVLKK